MPQFSVIGIILGLLLALSVPAAPDARAVGGTSTRVILGLDKLPCDGVIYPVALSSTSSSRQIYAPTNLVQGVLQKISYGTENVEKDSISDSYTDTLSLAFDFAPQFNSSFLVTSGGKTSFGYTRSMSTTYTNEQSNISRQSNEVNLKANIPGIQAVPTEYRTSGWGQYYRCDVNGSAEQVGGASSLKFDVATATGWVLSKTDGSPLSSLDITV